MTFGKGIELKTKELETFIWTPVGFGSSIKRISTLKQIKLNFRFPTI